MGELLWYSGNSMVELGNIPARVCLTVSERGCSQSVHHQPSTVQYTTSCIYMSSPLEGRQAASHRLSGSKRWSVEDSWSLHTDTSSKCTRLIWVKENRKPFKCFTKESNSSAFLFFSSTNRLNIILLLNNKRNLFNITLSYLYLWWSSSSILLLMCADCVVAAAAVKLSDWGNYATICARLFY